MRIMYPLLYTLVGQNTTQNSFYREIYGLAVDLENNIFSKFEIRKFEKPTNPSKSRWNSDEKLVFLVFWQQTHQNTKMGLFRNFTNILG